MVEALLGFPRAAEEEGGEGRRKERKRKEKEEEEKIRNGSPHP